MWVVDARAQVVVPLCCLLLLMAVGRGGRWWQASRCTFQTITPLRSCRAFTSSSSLTTLLPPASTPYVTPPPLAFHS